MNKRFYSMLSFLFVHAVSIANNIQINSVSIVNNGPGNIQVQFNVRWENSWRVTVGPNNYDAAYVFFKYRTLNGAWRHLLLTGSNNVVPEGFELSDARGTGAMIHRAVSNLGKGINNVQGVRLGIDSRLPYDVDVQAFAIEMVYIPASFGAGEFTILGDGNGTNESQNAFHNVNNKATTGSTSIKVDANSFDDAKLINGLDIYPNDRIESGEIFGPPDVPFPTMGALWCMKYEISQAGYRDFLNTLTLAQQTTRTTNPPTSVKGTSALAIFPNINRNYLEISVPSLGGSPAIYGCDANKNNIFNEAGDGEWIACNYLSWPDVAAYMAWSGLAPMSEIQYERICRGHTSAGPNAAVYGEYAWGTNSIFNTRYTLLNANATSEIKSNNTGTFGNAVWSNTLPVAPNNGPLRNGVFATASSNRISSGASFFGVMEMSGNVSEYCISLGTVAGRSVKIVPNGTGNLSATGNAIIFNSSGSWPGINNNNSSATSNVCTSGPCEIKGVAGIMLRGGSLASTTSNSLAVSYRSSELPSLIRNVGYGGRGVRYIR